MRPVGFCCATPDAEFVGGAGIGKVRSCDAPNLLICLSCDGEWFLRCGSTRQSRCVPCAATYVRRVATLVGDGLAAAAPGSVAVLTLTAPGNGAHCSRHRRCEGKGGGCEPCRCTPSEGVDLAEWNASLTARWNRFLEAVRRGEASPLVRGRRQLVPLSYVRAVEVQGRGALHVHAPLIRSDGKALQLRVRDLRRLAIEHKFGHSLRWDARPSLKSAPWYVAKYVGKAADQRASVPWPADADGVKRPGAMYRTWTSSRCWPVSMATVRAAARERARLAAGEGPQAPLDLSCGSYARKEGEPTAAATRGAMLALIGAFWGPPPLRDLIMAADDVEMSLQGVLWEDRPAGSSRSWSFA